jgi:hypothetical protein
MTLWLLAGEAWAGSLRSDVAFAYGRNLGQQLNVAAVVAEVKATPEPHLAVGVRLAGGVGVSLSGEGAKAYLGAPLLLKAEGSPLTGRNRPYLGLGLGVTPTVAAGAFVRTDRANVEAAGWAVRGVIPTLMPEIGVDLSGFRLAFVYHWMVGSAKEVAAGVNAGTQGVTTSTAGEVPGLDGIFVQGGFSFGGRSPSPPPPVAPPAP